MTYNFGFYVTLSSILQTTMHPGSHGGWDQERRVSHFLAHPNFHYAWLPIKQQA
jgi:hypothetical protein